MSSEALTLKYRPQRFEAIVGQKFVARTLAKMVENDDVPPALIFSGPSGTGKTTAARILANKLSGTLDDVIEVDAASNGGVAEIRKIIDMLRYSALGKRRLVILDEAHSLTREAFNALLLTLESPPANCVFVLVTTEPYKIPETVLSRLIEFDFRAVTPEEILQRISAIASAESFDAEPGLLMKIADISQGNVREAVKILDQVIRAEVSSVDELEDLLNLRDVGPELMSALTTGDPSCYYEVLDTLLFQVGSPAYVLAQLQETLRDLLVLKSGGRVKSIGKRLKVRTELAARVSSSQVVDCMKFIWVLKTKVKNSPNPKGDLELVCTMFATVLSVTQTIIEREIVVSEPITQDSEIEDLSELVI